MSWVEGDRFLGLIPRISGFVYVRSRLGTILFVCLCALQVTEKHGVPGGQRLSEGQCEKSRGRTQVFLQARESLNFNPKGLGEPENILTQEMGGSSLFFLLRSLRKLCGESIGIPFLTGNP